MWVKQCICSVKYSIMVNGGHIGSVSPSRGLRQGDPLSPYLFLLVADVFSKLMSKAVSNKAIGGIKMRRKCPMLSHLLFADDSLIFLEAVPQYCINFRELIENFSEASELSLNIHKSSLCFSTNTKEAIRGEIKKILGMEEMGESAQYLGLPVYWGKSKREALNFSRIGLCAKLKDGVTFT